jgi:serine/threonine protein kinase
VGAENNPAAKARSNASSSVGTALFDPHKSQESLGYMSKHNISLKSPVSVVASAVPSRDPGSSSAYSPTPANPKLDYILDQMDEDALSTFRNHNISDMWLPLSKQSVRRLFADGQQAKTFLRLQDDILDSDLHVLEESRATLTNIAEHTTLDDDEDFIRDLRVLGEGACGIVEEVYISASSVQCVRKRIGRPKLLKAQKQIMTAFAREVSVMRQVNHQHCVSLLGSYTDFDHVNILSSPVADMNLATFLDLPMEEKHRDILYRGFGCLCHAILHLHQSNIRHEDLKPQNVLIHGDNILLTDFGFSLDFSDDSVSTTTGRPSAWTLRYSAPEVLNFEPRNRATDIWSLGCVLLEMASGFYGLRLQELKEKWKHTGNGQSSFARNNDAVRAWFRDAQLLDKDEDAPAVKHLCLLIRLMLSKDRLHRPTAQQIVDRISDLRVLVAEHPPRYTATCKGPKPCAGLAGSGHNVKLGMQLLRGLQDLAKYLYPWYYPGWTFGLWDLSWNIISMDGCETASYPFWANPIQENRNEIQAAAKRLYNSASRSPPTSSFWKAHNENLANNVHIGDMMLSSDGKAQVQSSANMLSMKQAVFVRLELNSRWWRPDSIALMQPPKIEMRQIQITLLPVCIPRSPLHGCFFWMLSWSAVEPAPDLDDPIAFISS